MRVPAPIKNTIEKMSPIQRQWAMVAFIGVTAVSVLWVVFTASSNPTKVDSRQQAAANGTPSRVTNIGVMPGGAQVDPVDQWVGTAGRKLDQYESDRHQQEKLNKDQTEFQGKTMQRFADLEQKLSTQSAGQLPQPLQTSPTIQAGTSSAVVNRPPPGYPPSTGFQNAQALPPPPPVSRSTGALTGSNGIDSPGLGNISEAASGLVRVTLRDPSKPSSAQVVAGGAAGKDSDAKSSNVDTYLPVSFTRGILLGGLDAPTGGQSQSNPHPILIRLEDNAVLPNRFRSQVKECFVVAAGYGDISSERAYLRTENLSCVRNDGTTLEVKIQGAVYGEDGKVGIRGRLVTKQGQILANALATGVLSGIGQGFGQQNSTVSSSALGTISTSEGGSAFKRGIGMGVGRALDRLAQYYIKLAEQTFPVIEVDAGRQVDVVITKGVRIDIGEAGKQQATSNTVQESNPAEHLTRTSNDDEE